MKRMNVNFEGYSMNWLNQSQKEDFAREKINQVTFALKLGKDNVPFWNANRKKIKADIDSLRFLGGIYENFLKDFEKIQTENQNLNRENFHSVFDVPELAEKITEGNPWTTHALNRVNAQKYANREDTELYACFGKQNNTEKIRTCRIMAAINRKTPNPDKVNPCLTLCDRMDFIYKHEQVFNSQPISGTTYKIKEGIKTIGESVFDVSSVFGLPYDFRSFQFNLVMPESLEEIQKYAFYNCQKMEDINFGAKSNLRFIGPKAFYMTGLTQIDLRNTKLLKLEVGTFLFCRKLESVLLPDTLQEIRGEVFYECVRLTRIEIPNSVHSIGFEAFKGCQKLSRISLPNSLTSLIHGIFDGCTSLEKITVPESVTVIEAHAFKNCSSLVSVTIPPSVQKIHIKAFAKCFKLDNATTERLRLHFVNQNKKN